MDTQDKSTIEYYNSNAAEFVNHTLSADMSETRSRFTSHIPQNGYILDFGCGSGRDSLGFIQDGFRVDAVDGSKELCKIAEEIIDRPVACSNFNDLDESEKYDGIWACASILHLQKSELMKVISKMIKALKSDGVAYISFKYGTYEGFRNGRYFTDMTETSLKDILPPEAAIIDEWISTDVRPEHENEKWLNAIIRKNK